jgi:hypothetical protein
MATAWVLTRGLDWFRTCVNRRWPKRDKKSDGTIGDLAHQLESASGHNPDKTGKAEWKDGDSLNEVRAFDMDNNLNEPGTTYEMFIQFLIVELGRKANVLHLVFRYIIYNGRIWAASTGWKTQTYNGPSKHTEHGHFSGAYTQASDNNTTFDYRLNEVGHVAMSLTTDDVNAIVGALRKAYTNPDDALAGVSKAAPWQYGTGITAAGLQYSGKSMLYQQTMVAANVEAMKAALATILTKVTEDDKEAAQIIAAMDAQLNAVRDQLNAEIDQVDENVIAKLGDPATPDEEVADALVSLLGSRKDAVLALMASSAGTRS